MNRRKFFGAMAGVAAVPVVVLAKAPPVFDPVVHIERVQICCNMTGCSLLDAAGRIHELAGRAPSAYRLTTGPWLYLNARSTEIAKMMWEEYQAEIVVVMDSAITDADQWSLDALGIKIWSPGA